MTVAERLQGRGFHEGELSVQERAGTRAEAARLVGMLAPPDLGGGARIFLATQRFAALTARDLSGRLWISPLTGPPGFLDAAATTLRIKATPVAGDPLHGLPAGQPAGLLVIDFARRRRMRLNGQLVVAGDTLGITVDQAYGNCPQYIHPRTPALDSDGGSGPAAATIRRTTGLSPSDIEVIRGSDTFLLGTTHPERGNDASHRGGPAGFVRVDGGSLSWPDYPGNAMFNSFGNLAVDDTAALLFMDATTGDTLHLSGRATLEWLAPGEATDDGGTCRRVRFTPTAVVSARRPGVRRGVI